MAIARVQTTVGGGDGSQGTSLATSNFGSSCTSGNYIIVCVRNGTSGDELTGVTDTLGTSYSEAIKDSGQDPSLYIYYGKLTSSGTNAVTGAFGVSANYAFVYAIEVSGLAASSALDATNANTGSGVTDLTSGAFSTAQADEYVLLLASQNNLYTYTVGADFTLVDGSIPTNPGDFGGIEERITSSTLSSYTAHITSSGSGSYVVLVATFKGAASGSTPSPAAGAMTLTGQGTRLGFTFNMPDEA
jgi:hypothetical protein